VAIVGSIELPGYEVHDVDVVGDIAYVAAGHISSYGWCCDKGILSIYNVNDSANPVLLGSVETNGDAYDVEVVGDNAYLADRSYLKIIDVSNPESPTITASVNTGAYEVKVNNNYAYVAAGSGGFKVVDITNAEAPVVVGSVDRPSTNYYYYSNIDIYGDRAYLVYYGSHSSDKVMLQIININTPTSPTQLGTLELQVSENFADIAVSDNTTAYITLGNSGIMSINVSNPASPTIISHFNTLSYVDDIAISGDTAYAMGDVLYELNISDPSKITNTGWCGVGGIYGQDSQYNNGIKISNNKAYIANGLSKVQIVDISQPLNKPTSTSFLDTQSNVTSMKIDNNTAYISTTNNQFKMLDISNPDNPEVISSIEIIDNSTFIGASPTTLAVYNDKAYIAVNKFDPNQTGSFQIIDISNPESPTRNGVINNIGHTNAIAISNNKAYLAQSYWYDNGNRRTLQIIDVSIPNNPQLLISLNNPSNSYHERASDIAIKDDNAFVTYAKSDWNVPRTGILQTIDISTSSNPTLTTISLLNLTGNAESIAISGNYAFIATALGPSSYSYTGGSLEVLDISNAHITTPTIISTLDLEYPAIDVNLSGKLASVLVSEDSNFANATLSSNLTTVLIDITDPLSPKKISSMKTLGRSKTIIKDNTAYVAGPGFSTLSLPEELGIVGIMLFAWLTWYIIKYARQLLIADTQYHYLIIAMFICIAGFMINSCFSFPLRRALPPVIIMTYLGILSVMYSKVIQSSDINISSIMSGTCFASGIIAFTLLLVLHLNWIECDRFFILMNTAERHKVWPPVIDYGKKAIKLNPYRKKLNASLGLAYLKTNEPQKAIIELEKVMDSYPYHTNAMFNLGVAYFGTKNLKKALQVFQQYKSIRPDYAKVHYNLGHIHLNLKQYKQAQKAFEKTLQLKPQWEEAKKYLQISKMAGLTKEQKAKLYQSKANIFMKQKQFDKAINAYDQAIHYLPKDPVLYFNKGSALLQKAKYAQAKKAFEKAITYKPDWALAYKFLGIISYDFLKQKKQGIAFFKKALDLDPLIKEHKIIRQIIATAESQISIDSTD